MQNVSPRYIIGIDEAGRGPIAGPVTVGAVALPAGYDASCFEGIRDSKKLPEHKREFFYERLHHERDRGMLRYAVRSVGPHIIDREGIVYAVSAALQEALRSLSLSPDECHVMLDGSLRAPRTYTSQETIIKGDTKILAIQLAAVAAKVTRDRKMIEYSARYPGYAFEEHKGYGTVRHYDSLREQGVCDIHRRSFISQFV